MEFRKNQITTVKIDDIGMEGEGIGKAEGFTLFVKDAVAGDIVEAQIVKVKKNYAYARLEKVVTPSPFRVEPKCVCYRQCGGCQLQALSYERQLQFKQNKIRNNLIRIGGFSAAAVDGVMEPVIGMEEPWHYRNKAQYPVGRNREGHIVTGFYAGRTHSIIANTDCALGAVENKEILGIILEYMNEYHVAPYDETMGTGLVRHVLIRKGFASGELMVCLVLNRGRAENPARSRSGMKRSTRHSEKAEGFLPGQAELLRKLSRVKGMTSVSVSLNRECSNVIMGKEVHTIWGRDTISDTIRVRDMGKAGYPFLGKALTFHISPLSFYQVNPLQTEKLYSLALEYAELTGRETVWDLYCGIGTISLFLAGSAEKVYGVEAVPEAIRDARKNAERNGVRNVEFFTGKAEEMLSAFYRRGEEAVLPRPDVIVVDPPRKGCDKACLEAMLKARPERIVYVSCDPATLARDLKILCEGGYELRRVRGVDQFGMTVHIETVVLLSKGEIDSQKVRVEFSLENMDMSGFRQGATYQEIKDYVKRQTGLSVSSLYISQIKRKCGLEVGQNYHLAKSDDTKVPKCPPEKEKAIREALEYFGMA